jgi:hypothetical protein
MNGVASLTAKRARDKPASQHSSFGIVICIEDAGLTCCHAVLTVAQYNLDRPVAFSK